MTKIYQHLYLVEYQNNMSKESERIRNQLPKRKAYRKYYKQTEAGKRSNKKYRNKPEVKERNRDLRLRIRYGITMSQYWNLVAALS